MRVTSWHKTCPTASCTGIFFIAIMAIVYLAITSIVNEKSAGYDADMDGKTLHAGLILCAGLSSRMGDFKPLLPLDGEKTMVECAIDSMERAGVDHIVLVLGHRGDDILRVLGRRDRPFLKTVRNPRYADTDMMESARIGLAAVQSWDAVEAFFVLPADMPIIRSRTYGDLIRCMRRNSCKVVVPVYRDKAGHPPLVHADCLERLLAHDGEGGLKAALGAFSRDTVYLPVDDRGCVLDADTPADYRSLLSYHNSGTA
jgi:CTP:molybdopterin cytidylyltransferase MocA